MKDVSRREIYIELMLATVMLLIGIGVHLFITNHITSSFVLPVFDYYRMLFPLLMFTIFLHAGIPKPIIALFLTLFLYPIFSVFYFALTATHALDGLGAIFLNITMMPLTIFITLIVSRVSFHIRETDRLRKEV